MNCKRKKTKLMLIVFAAAVIFSLMMLASVPASALDIDPSAVSTESDFTITEHETHVTIDSYHGTAPNVVIPEQINGKNVTALSTKVFDSVSGENIIPAASITSLSLPSTLASIDVDMGSFKGLKGLETITVAAGNTNFTVGADGALYNTAGTQLYLVPKTGTGTFAVPNTVQIIEPYAFEGARYETITMGNGVTSIGEGAFYCAEMTSITLSSHLGELGKHNGAAGAFENCSNLESISIPASLNEIRPRTFAYCLSLASVTFGHDSNSYIRLYGYSFLGTTSLKSITFPRWTHYIDSTAFEGSGVTEMTGYADTAVKTYTDEHPGVTFNEIVVPAPTETYTYTEIDGGIKITGYNGSATNLEIPAIYEGYPVLTIGQYAFQNKSSIVTVVVPEGVTTIEDRAFYNCYNMTSIEFPSTLRDFGWYVFQNCSKLLTISVSEDNLYYSSVNGILYNKNQTYLIYVPARYTADTFTVPESVTGIYQGTFNESRNIRKVIVTQNVSTIVQETFTHSSIEEVVLSEGVRYINSNAFYAVNNLQSVTLPSTIVSIDRRAFTANKYISFTAPQDSYAESWLKSNLYPLYVASEDIHTDGDFKYYVNEDGETVTIYKYIGSGGNVVIPQTIDGKQVTVIGGRAFFENERVTAVTVPSGVKDIGFWTFGSCTNLRSVTLPDGLERIGNYAFDGCKTLPELTIPDSVRWIGNAFGSCFELEKITLPSSVDFMDGYDAFWSDYSLVELSLPEGFVYLENSALARCKSLSVVVLPSTFNNNGAYFNNSPVTLYGTSGSYAETYANNKGYTFCTYTVEGGNAYLESVTMNGKTKLSVPEKIYGYDLYINDTSVFDGISGITVYGMIGGSDAETVAAAKGYTFKGIGANYYTYTVNGEEVTITGYDVVDANGDNQFYIPQYIGGKLVKHIGEQAFKGTSLYSVSIPIVDDIGISAFENCSLQYASIAGVTELKSRAFYGSGLRYSLYTPEYVLDYIPGNANKQGTVYVPEGCVSIGNECFAYSLNVNNVNTPQLYLPSTLTSIGSGTFKSVSMYRDIVIAAGNTSFVNSNGFMTSSDGKRLIRCSAGGAVNIPSGVESIDDCCFFRNYNVTSITAPSSVKTVGTFAFRECTDLTTITFSEGLEEVGGWLIQKSFNVTTITFPSTLRTIGGSAFNKDFNYGGYDDSVNYRIVISASNPYYMSTNNDEAIYSIDSSRNPVSLIWVSQRARGDEERRFVVPDGVKRVDDRAFSRCIYLREIILPESVKEIGAYAFEYCRGLTDVKMPGVELIEGSEADIFNNYYSTYTSENNSPTKRLYISYAGGVVTEGLRVHGYRNSFVRSYITRINAANPTYKFDFIPIDADVETSGDLAAEVPNGSFEGEIPEFFATANEAAHNKSHLNEQNAILDYTLSFANFEQPDKGIEIRIPVAVFEAAGGKSNNPKIYYVSPNGRSISNVKGKRDGDYYVFWTPHFSDYAVMDSAIEFDNRPNIVVGDADVKAGNQFSVPIDISCNTGIATLVFDISFDNDIMTFVSAEDGGLFTGYNCAQVSDNTYRFTLTSDTDVTANGTLVTLNFEVGKKVFDSKNFISVTVDENNCKNAAGENVSTYSEFGEVDVVYFGRIDKKALAMGSEISFYYYAILSPEQVGAQMRFTINGDSVVVDGVATGTTNEYRYKFEGINPQCLGDNIKAELIMGVTVLDELDNFSVLSYCKSLLAKTPAELDLSQAQYDAMVTLIADLMEYGSASQVYVGHKTNELVNTDEVIAGLDAKTVFVPIEADHSYRSSSSSENVYFRSVGIYFSNINKLFFTFKADGVSDDFRIEIRDFRGNTKVYELSDCVVDGEYYKIYTDAISALYLAHKDDNYYTFRITLKDHGETIQYYDCNITSYVYLAQGQSTVKANLSKALYNYGLSAIAYRDAK